MDIEITCITSWEDLRPEADAWATLLAQSDADPVFMSWPWVEAWWHHLGEAYELLVYILRHENIPIGIIPLIRRKKEGFKQLAVVGVGRSDYQAFLLHPAHADACMQAFLDQILPAVPDWDFFQCTRLLEGTQTANLLERGLLNTSFKGKIAPFDVAPFAPLPADWAAYRDAHVRKKIVKDSERQHRRLEREVGPVTFRQAEDLATLNAWFPELVHFHQVRRNEVKNDFSMFNDSHVQDFYHAAVCRLFEAGRVRMDALYVGDDLAALHLGFVAQNRFYYTLPVMNWAFEKYSVGRLLLLELMAQCAATGPVAFDFGYGDEAYKYDFTEARRTMLDVMIANRTAKGRAAWIWHTGMRKKIKENDLFMGKILPRLKSGGVITEGS